MLTPTPSLTVETVLRVEKRLVLTESRLRALLAPYGVPAGAHVERADTIQDPLAEETFAIITWTVEQVGEADAFLFAQGQMLPVHEPVPSAPFPAAALEQAMLDVPGAGPPRQRTPAPYKLRGWPRPKQHVHAIVLDRLRKGPCTREDVGKALDAIGWHATSGSPTLSRLSQIGAVQTSWDAEKGVRIYALLREPTDVETTFVMLGRRAPEIPDSARI